MSQKQILCVANGYHAVQFIKNQLHKYSLTFVANDTKIVEQCSTQPYDLIICGYNLFGGASIGIIRAIRKKNPTLRILIMFDDAYACRNARTELKVATIRTRCTGQELLCTVDKLLI